jgi:uncharacterized protein YcbX
MALTRVKARMPAHIAALFQYPIKGFTPQSVETAPLDVGGVFPGDRLMAVEDGPCGFDPADPAFIRKSKFTVLARSAAVAKIRTHLALETGHLSARAPDAEAFEGQIADPATRDAFAAWLTHCLARIAPGEFSGPLRLVEGGDHRFTDHPKGHVSLLNLASVRELETRLGVAVDPARFRANIHVEGWPAWAENEWTGHALRLGAARARVFAPIVRCAATCADPATGVRDHDIPAALHRLYGHVLCGIYVQVEAPGEVRVGDEVETL